MRLLTQPNEWTCCATAYAMTVGITVKEAFDIAGHDGSKVLWADLDDPQGRRGHTLFEFIEHAQDTGHYFTFFPLASPVSNEPGYERLIWTFDEQVDIFERQHSRDMVILGQKPDGAWHNIVWDAIKQIYLDPGGRYANESTIEPKAIWTISRSKEAVTS